MSIWCSSFELSDEGYEDGRDGPAPLSYRASHVMPSLADFRSGSLDLGLIPGFVTHDGWCVLGVDHTSQVSTREECTCEPLNELPAVWPFLRVGLRLDDHNAVTVILDRSQAEKLRDALTDWLGRAVTS